MKRFIMLFALCSVLPVFAADDPATPAKKEVKPAAKAAKAPGPLVIPKAATQNGDGTFSYTDKQGKQWRYMNTPFGVSRLPASEVPGAGLVPPTPVAQPEQTKAIDRGDTIRFERSTPFGTTAWEKKKSDLTDDERRIFEAQYPPPQPPTAPSPVPESHE